LAERQLFVNAENTDALLASAFAAGLQVNAWPGEEPNFSGRSLSSEATSYAEHLFSVCRDCYEVGEVSNGRALINDVERLNPDLLMTELVVPGVSGLNAALSILRRAPDQKVQS
jgi:CheY-like chemotaxis protein